MSTPMRSREEIKRETVERFKLLSNVKSDMAYQVFLDPILEVLLDIRELLLAKE